MTYRVTTIRSEMRPDSWATWVDYGEASGIDRFDTEEKVLQQKYTWTRWGARLAARSAIRGHRKELRLREKNTVYRVEA